MIFPDFFKEIYVRDKGTLFWIFLFPTVMYLLFSSIFGGIGKDLSFKIGLVGESRYFEEAVSHMGMNVKELTFEDVDSLKEAVSSKRIDLGIDLRNFDRNLMLSVLSRGRYKTEVRLYASHDDVSKLALELFRAVFENSDIEMLKILGKAREIKVEYIKRESEMLPGEYYAITGIVLALMGTGLFGVTYGMSDLRGRKILKRFVVSPVSTHVLFFEIVLVHFLAAILSAGVVFSTAFLLGNMEFDPFEYPLMPLLGAVLYISLGYAIYSLSNSREVASILANITYFVMMFTGNLYFETMEGPMKIVSSLNPTSYLARIMRKGEIRFLDLFVILIWTSAGLLVSWISHSRGERLA